MGPSHANKRGVRYRYYVRRALLDRPMREKPGTIPRVFAPDLEVLVDGALLRETRTETDGSDVGGAFEREVIHTGLIRWITGLVRRVDIAQGCVETTMVGLYASQRELGAVANPRLPV
jgi:hypothetical protein